MLRISHRLDFNLNSPDSLHSLFKLKSELSRGRSSFFPTRFLKHKRPHLRRVWKFIAFAFAFRFTSPDNPINHKLFSAVQCAILNVRIWFSIIFQRLHCLFSPIFNYYFFSSSPVILTLPNTSIFSEAACEWHQYLLRWRKNEKYWKSSMFVWIIYFFVRWIVCRSAALISS